MKQSAQQNERIRRLLRRAFVLIASCVIQQGVKAFDLKPDVTIRFATVGEGQARLGVSSAATRAMTPLDRAFSMARVGDTSESEYLQYAANQVLGWTPSDTNRLVRALAQVRDRLAGIDLRLPAEIYLINTTGKESFGGSYTGNDFIAWAPEPANPYGIRLTEWILTHELFHVLSRFNPSWRAELYKALGFFPCGDVPLPEKMRARLVTNPDALDNHYAVHLWDGRALITGIPLLYYKATNQLSGRSILDFADFNVFELMSHGDGYVPVTTSSGDMVPVNDVAKQDYARKTGNNTGYVIHPEEIAAEHFALLADPENWPVNSPRVLHLFRTALASPLQSRLGWPAGRFEALLKKPAPNAELWTSENLLHWRSSDFMEESVLVDPEAFQAKARFYHFGPGKLFPNVLVDTNAMIWIPPGEITTTEGITLSSGDGFWIGRCEVTTAEYASLNGMNGSGGDLPAVNVSWDEAAAYCKKLNESGKAPAGFAYRLPTENEWEYACRAGNPTPYASGSSFHDIAVYTAEWFSDNSNGRAHRVRLKLANPFGLHDMGGNVKEWTGTLIESGEGSDAEAVVRGGSYQSNPRDLSPSFFTIVSVSTKSPEIGMRVVLAPFTNLPQHDQRSGE